MSSNKMDYGIAVPTVVIIFMVFGVLAIWPDEMRVIINQIYEVLVQKMGWSFLVINVLAFAVLIWLSISGYGNIVLGETEKPEYSNFSWASMLFTSGVGSSAVILGFIEPLYYVKEPPFNILPYSKDAYEYAHLYGQFHWGASAWAFYIPAIIAVGLVVYKAKVPELRLSSVIKVMCAGKKSGGVRKIIDIMVMIGVLGGISTSLGLAVPVISSIFSKVFKLENNLQLQIVVLLSWVLLFSFSVFRGLDKGIKLLSDLNIALLFLFLLVMFNVGTFTDIVKMEMNSVGLYFQNFARMSTWTDPFGSGEFQEMWTIFYWAWWLTFMPLMALFIVRISRGRKLISVVWHQLIWGTLGCWACFGVFGGVSLGMQKGENIDLAMTLEKYGQEAVVIQILENVPHKEIVGILFCLLVFIFLATTIDSAAYVLASNSCKNMLHHEQPKRIYRIFWAGILALLSIGLLIIGELKAVQTMSLIASIPLIPVQLYLCWSGIKLAKKYGDRKQEENNHEKSIYMSDKICSGRE